MGFEVNTRKASEKKKLARILIEGPAGSGKTFTGLGLCDAIARIDGRGGVLAIDTQGGQADMYADKYIYDVQEIPPEDHDPRNFIKVIEHAELQGYSCILVDSMTHAWEWTLKFVGDLQSGQKSKWTAWGEGGEPWGELINKILFAKIHIIACSRSKVAYEQKEGKVHKLGMQPIVRAGTDFEFDMVLSMTAPDNTLIVNKGRAVGLNGQVARKPGAQFFKKVTDWLFSGEEAAPREQPMAGDPAALKTKMLELKALGANAEALGKNLAEEYKFADKWASLAKLGPVAAKELMEKIEHGIELHSVADPEPSP